MIGLDRSLRERIAAERGMWEVDVFLSDELGEAERYCMKRAESKWWEDVELELEPVERVGVLDFGYLCSYIGGRHE